MSNIATVIGQRIRSYRLKAKLSQERLAELAGCHPTYIGQLERGEKNATLESIERIASALKIPLSELFEMVDCKNNRDNIPMSCYNLILPKTEEEQKTIFKILNEIDKYKTIK